MNAPNTTIRSSGPRRIALMNQKGGVGKTTTSVNLGAALALQGKKVLFIDLDPQAHMTLHLGVNPDELEHSVYDLLTEPNLSPLEVLIEVGDNMSLLPAEVNLAGVEAELASLTTHPPAPGSPAPGPGPGSTPSQGAAQHILRDKVLPILGLTTPSPVTPSPLDRAESRALGPDSVTEPHLFDYVILDCPPSLGLLTINALALATEVVVPMQAHFLALQGLSKLLTTVGMVRQAVNPPLEVTGIVVGLYDGQTALAREVMADLAHFLEAARTMDVPWRRAVMLQPPIRRNVKLAECPSFGQTIFDYAPLCPGAHDYRALAESVMKMKRPG